MPSAHPPPYIDHDDDDGPLTMPSPASSIGVEFTKSSATVTDNETESIGLIPADATTASASLDPSAEEGRHRRRRRSSGWFPTKLQQVDLDERPRGQPMTDALNRRQSFIEEFASTSGPPQIAGLMILIAVGLGCTIGVVPAVMADRFARLEHGWDGPPCQSLTHTAVTATVNVEACMAGSADAQTAVATSNLISNGLTFLTSSLLGSWSDQHGRKVLLTAGMAVGAVPPFCCG